MMYRPAALLQRPQVGHSTLPLHRFSTDDYLRMIDAGVLRASDRVELIDGMLVATSPRDRVTTMCFSA